MLLDQTNPNFFSLEPAVIHFTDQLIDLSRFDGSESTVLFQLDGPDLIVF